ncbi:MAG: DNA gyrase inhibitor YacG [Gammaproteobacteria bacterium]|nr:DNA gyrase inhibitor YacG [Gammaproteobacteria bacterium]
MHARCPRCGAATSLDPGNHYRPFCSERCRMVDLHGWATETYRIPGTSPSPVGGEDGTDTPFQAPVVTRN